MGIKDSLDLYPLGLGHLQRIYPVGREKKGKKSEKYGYCGSLSNCGSVECLTVAV